MVHSFYKSRASEHICQFAKNEKNLSGENFKVLAKYGETFSFLAQLTNDHMID